MENALEINNRQLYAIKDVAEKVSYSRDYVTHLAREGKIIASYVGRQWFVDLDSLKSYASDAATEKEIRKKQLSSERLEEKNVREATAKHLDLNIKKSKTLHVRAVVTASMVLALGVLGGFISVQSNLFFQGNPVQVASTQGLSVSEGVKKAPSTIENNSPAELLGTVPVQDDVTTRSIRLLGDVQQGILLIPNAGNATVTSMFSDVVKVVGRSDGSRVVTLIDSDGQETGLPVPFLVLPVEDQS